jgi:hypothetical protein
VVVAGDTVIEFPVTLPGIHTKVALPEPAAVKVRESPTQSEDDGEEIVTLQAIAVLPTRTTSRKSRYFIFTWIVFV